ncbi:MAG: GNAT family N-acetyltransferase [Azospirillum sp.]|nr:GNAT family N-acetyltransferase [Azospirillum sp.]
MRIERLTGDALRQRLDDLARLRVTVFRDWPYLYDGSLDYEARYLETLGTTEGSVIVGAFAEDRLVGAATGLPLSAEPADLTDPFRHHGLAVERYFYFGESVLLKPWRGRGIGVGFFEHREAHARALGGFAATCFCGVVRPAEDPRRPAGYLALDDFWRRRGYSPMPGVTGTISWREIGEATETAKPMAFWSKPL